MKLQKHETRLVGRWLTTANGVVGDDVTDRILALTSGHLDHLAADPTGWEHLYADPDDDRLWELTYPHSEWQGGGPPCLEVVSPDTARQKYGWSPPEA